MSNQPLNSSSASIQQTSPTTQPAIRWSKLAVASLICMLYAPFLILVMVVLDKLSFHRLGNIVEDFILLAPFAIIASVVLGVMARRRLRQHQQNPDAEPVILLGHKMALISIILSSIQLFLSGLFILMIPFSRGRQLKKRSLFLGDRGNLFAPLRENHHWLSDPKPIILAAPTATPSNDDTVQDTALHAALAVAWRENGLTEHASVAAFARLSVDLLALGAPMQLIMDAHQDAIDEIRHTDLCFSLARDLDGQAIGPAAFADVYQAKTLPQGSHNQTRALAALAVDSIVEGAFHEGVSARVLGLLSKRVENQRVVDLLKQIAADEGRHAAHGWDVALWCLQAGGLPVATAVRHAVEKLPKTLHTTRSAAAVDGSWEKYGIHGVYLEQECYDKLRSEVISRVFAETEHFYQSNIDAIPANPQTQKYIHEQHAA